MSVPIVPIAGANIDTNIVDEDGARISGRTKFLVSKRASPIAWMGKRTKGEQAGEKFVLVQPSRRLTSAEARHYGRGFSLWRGRRSFACTCVFGRDRDDLVIPPIDKTNVLAAMLLAHDESKSRNVKVEGP